MSFTEAVRALLGENGAERVCESVQHNNEKEIVFELPERNEDNRRVYAYLRKRGIAHQVINGYLEAGLLYEDKQYHNCIFVGIDAKGNAAFAYKRGTYDKDGTGFKGDVPGSDKNIAFKLPCDPENDAITVFESPIDLMSYQTLHRELTSNAVALCCLHDGALESCLDENTNINTIVLCLDNDEWGQKAVARLTEKYTERGCIVYDLLPPSGKDWNEYVQIKNSHKKERHYAR